MRFIGALCVFAALIPALSAPASLAVPAQDQTPATQPESAQTQTTPPNTAPVTVPPAADQLPEPQSKIEFQKPFEPLKAIEDFSSPYIPTDNWIYPAMMRLYGLGYVDTEFVSMRPWTRLSVIHMLDQGADRISDSNNEEAIGIYRAVLHELAPDARIPMDQKFGRLRLESVYTRFMGISGTPLRDSFHLGQTDVNDFGRPYAEGVNNYSGVSGYATYGRFSAYFRGEYQHAPSWAGYDPVLSNILATLDGYDSGAPVSLVGNTTIPSGPIATTNKFTILEGYVSAHLLGNEISFGKMDNWYGPGVGGGMSWSTNAENVYSFRINRVEPLYIPYISKIAGLIRYDFFVGPLKGHNVPISPWEHSEKISFKPTPNFEFSFERTVIWGGIGHAPITLGTFWHSFYSISDTTGAEKFSRNDPGARFSANDFSWRLPYLRKWLTLYCDSEVHDDVFPITAPRHAAVRPGLYLSHFPGAPKLDLRVEGTSTDPDTGLSHGGQDMYIEIIQRNGYTNNGLLMADWVGREGKGGQAWLTYHLSPQEWLQLSYRNAKADKDFIPGRPTTYINNKGVLTQGVGPGGTTQNLFALNVVKRLGPEVELNAFVQYETWLIPAYKTGRQSDTSTSFQLTWYPRRQKRF